MINENVFRLNKNGEPKKYHCYCRHPELIENYDKAVADTTQVWEVHHRREEFYSQKELKERGEYFDRPPEDLIFLTKAEHNKIDSHCKRMSEVMKGKHLNRKDLSKKILCVETGEIFESTMEAQRKTGVNQSNISQVCIGSRKTAGKLHWRYYN